jgi:hypothetical protein
MSTLDEVQRLLAEERRQIEQELGIGAEGASELDRVASAAKEALKRGRDKKRGAPEPTGPTRRSSRCVAGEDGARGRVRGAAVEAEVLSQDTTAAQPLA